MVSLFPFFVLYGAVAGLVAEGGVASLTSSVLSFASGNGPPSGYSSVVKLLVYLLISSVSFRMTVRAASSCFSSLSSREVSESGGEARASSASSMKSLSWLALLNVSSDLLSQTSLLVGLLTSVLISRWLAVCLRFGW